MSTATSTSARIPGPDLCASCHRRIHFPCELFRIVDCNRCQDQRYKCEDCDGEGQLLEHGAWSHCRTCNGEGELRGCPSCRGQGYFFFATQPNRPPLQCEDCDGEGLRPCVCNEDFQIKQYQGLCPGDCEGLDGARRNHPKPPTNPKDRSSKRGWGKVVFPYEDT